MRSSSKRIIKNKNLAPGEVVRLDTINEIAVTSITPANLAEVELEAPKKTEAEDVAEITAIEITQEAQKQAALLVKSARDEANNIKEQAYETGYQEGLAKAQSYYEKELQMSMRVFGKALDDLATTRKNVVAKAENDLARLLILIVNKVLRREIAKDNELVLRVIKDTLPLIAETETLTLEVNPEDFQIVAANKKTIASFCPNVREIRVIASETVERGGLAIQSSLGNIDARVSIQMEAILEELSKLTDTDSEGVLHE